VVSSTLSATAVLPLAVGAGIAAHNIWKTKSRTVGDIFGGTSKSSTSEVQDLIRHIKGGAEQFSYRELGNRIKQLEGKGTISPQAFMTVWERSLASIANEPLAASLRAEMMALNPFQKTSMEMGSLIQFAGDKLSGQSIQTRRAGMRFLRGIETLQSTGLGANQAFVSVQGFKRSAGANIGLRGLAKTHGDMAQRLRMMSQELGAPVKRVSFSAREGIAGRTLSVEFGLRGTKGFSLNIPMTIEGTGMINLGDQHYIAGAFGVLENNRVKSTMKYEDWAMLRASEGLFPKIKALSSKTDWEIGRLMSEFESELRTPLTWSQLAHLEIQQKLQCNNLDHPLYIWLVLVALYCVDEILRIY